MSACQNTGNQSAISILLVEDDRADYIFISQIFDSVYGSGQYQLTWVARADQAREEVAKRQHDVYLFDYNLGQTSGIELIQEIAEDGFVDIPIILLTGVKSHDLDVTAMDAGATDYLVKDGLTAEALERSIRYSIRQKKAETRVQFLAYHDPLTGLANRSLLHEHVERAVPMAKRHGEFSAIIFIDLDEFKTINDTMGHSSGDRLLVIVAERIRAVTRREDIVARLGGDEFVILLTMLGTTAEMVAEKAYQMAEKLKEALNQVYIIDGDDQRVGTSIGVTVIDQHSQDADQIIKHADIAMYRAKNEGKNTIRFFSADMEETVQGDLLIATELYSAIDNDELELYFQPIIDSKHDSVMALEALIRWHHPERGLTPPSLFISVAEKSDLIISIGNWVIKTACAYLKKWPKIDYISINISASHFEKPAFAIEIAEALSHYDIEHQRLVLELTETRLLENIDQAIHTMTQLRSLGVRLSLDDFGTGYSSLSTLKNLPFNFIKIDRSFVSEIGSSDRADALVAAIIAMSKALKLKVVGEGIEEKRQEQFLFAHGCDAMQGFYYSKPVPAHELEAKYPRLCSA
ncbi:MAG: EAL domain-containing protein [Gammaproteobacteria bacterium]|nr:EAL domain-containing protein [Gammaproteobacteria bacterium]